MQQGDRAATDEVFTRCAARLQRMARALMAKEGTAVFHPSDLVQETFVQKISGQRLKTIIQDREHFFSLMAAGMRQVLVDRSRVRDARKRTAPPLEELLRDLEVDPRRADLKLALAKLEKLDPSARELVRIKYEQGSTWEEAAERTGRPVGQLRAECDWVLEWLRAELR